MKRIFRIIPCLLVLSLIIMRCLAQSQIPAKIEHYSSEDGLSHDNITTVFKDHEGYMWFGTWCGLNRFDGNHFVSFKSIAGDSSNIGNNRIDHINEDNNGQLWLKAYDGQIYRFNKKNEQFRSLAVILKLRGKVPFDRILYAHDNEIWVSIFNGGLIYVPDIRNESTSYFWFKQNADAKLQIPSNKVNCFLKDSGGDVWVGTTAGLAHFSHRGTEKHYRLAQQFDGKAKMSVTAAIQTRDKIFFATGEGMLWYYQKNRKEFIGFRASNVALNNLLISKNESKLYVTSAAGELGVLNLKDMAWQKYNAPDNSPLHGMFEDRQGNIWIEPDKKGVLRFNKSGVFESYSQKNDSKKINGGNHFKVFEDKNGIVWCVLRDGGFGYFDETTDSFRYFHDEPGAKDHAFSNLVTVAFYDPSGVMWLHTDEHGLEKIIFQPRAFEQFLVKEPAVFQSDNEIRGLCVDRLNRLWVCTKAGEIYWLQQGKLVPARFSNLDGKLGAVYAIKEDSRGNVWMGTKAHGLFEAIPEDMAHGSYRLVNFSHDKNDPNSISSDQIYAIKEDNRGRIWIGTFDQGLNLLRTDKQKAYFLKINKEQNNYPPEFGKIRTIETDQAGRIWAGTTEGLIVIDEAGGQFICHSYSKHAGVKESLGNNDIQFIHRDRSGHMWLATSGGGLGMATQDAKGGDLHFINYTTTQGLANDYILSCTEDNANHLWVATKSSLSRFDLLTKKFKNYSSYDGLSHAGFSESTCENTHDGKLVFGTTKGYLIFDPNTVIAHPIRANLVFASLRVNNERIGIADSSGILHQGINYAQGITLRHNQNVISVDYSLLDYRFDSHLPFMYRLKGFDSYWHDNTNQLRATYTNIPAGNYVLEIKCVDPDRYSNLPYKSLALTVLPAPWLSWWAYLIYAVIILSIAVTLWRSTLTAMKLKHEMAVEHQLTELKLNFFTNISHELRTPLMLILNPVAQLIKNKHFDQRQQQYLEIVERNANRMVRFVNQLLDFRKVQHGKAVITPSRFEMTGFLRDISEHFDDVRQEKHISLVFKGFEQNFDVYFDQDKIETVIYNLLSNAYKFTPDGKIITISLDHNPDGKELTLMVTDQGCGVPESDLKYIFELYHSGEQALNSGKGTGIGLALSKELVELHGGTISAANNANGGLTVKVILPYEEPHELSGIVSNSEKTGNEEQMDNIQHTAARPASANAPLLLLVEDNLDMREFLRSQLSEIYRVETAADGLEGLEMVRNLMPDIVLSDVMMPGMDGIALIDKLKNDVNVSHIPVVLMSARSAVEHQIIGLNYGADYYLSKPFKNELLIAAINSILDRRKKLFQKLNGDKKVVNLAPDDVIVTSKDEVFLKKVVQIISENMADSDFDIEKVSHLVNMGRANFYKKFKSLTQIAPVEFVRDMRLQRAKQYFDAGGGNVAEIAYTVGFSSPKYFSTCFRTKYNISPSDYLRSNKPVITEETHH
jgi:signal transduction histidine kinase/ligand-binding sensor domain-containing protein/CheY-like chemotaxis protein/AraC-like DNA-binding protein